MTRETFDAVWWTVFVIGGIYATCPIWAPPIIYLYLKLRKQ